MARQRSPLAKGVVGHDGWCLEPVPHGMQEGFIRQAKGITKHTENQVVDTPWPLHSGTGRLGKIQDFPPLQPPDPAVLPSLTSPRSPTVDHHGCGSLFGEEPQERTEAALPAFEGGIDAHGQNLPVFRSPELNPTVHQDTLHELWGPDFPVRTPIVRGMVADDDEVQASGGGGGGHLFPSSPGIMRAFGMNGEHTRYQDSLS